MESVDGASGGLDAAMLYARCDPAGFGFETTAELEDLEGAIGQARAVNAVRFGVEVGRVPLLHHEKALVISTTFFREDDY